MPKSRGFMFWYQDWECDEVVRDLDATGRGVYLELLIRDYIEDGLTELPRNSRETLAKQWRNFCQTLGINRRNFWKTWSKVSQKFDETEGGRFRSRKRLRELVRLDRERTRKRKSRGRPADASSLLESSLVPSSSPPLGGKEDEGRTVAGQPPAQPRSAAVGDRPEGGKVAAARHHIYDDEEPAYVPPAEPLHCARSKCGKQIMVFDPARGHLRGDDGAVYCSEQCEAWALADDGEARK